MPSRSTSTTTRLLGLLCAFILAAEAAYAADTPAAKPNILFILADDWGWGDLGCHGNKLVNTPNIDRLAREGTEFYQFNVGSPVCSPSRVAFMTGQFPARFSVHEAIGGTAKNREAGQVDWLDPTAVIVTRLLKEAGYVTGHFGKWHLCARVVDAPMPIAYGVDEHALWVAPPNAVETDHREVFDDAVAFLREHKDRPFYVNLWIKETHLAHDPSEQSLKEHAHLDEQQRIYSAVVADGDKGVGKVLAALKELGLEDNTIVIFTSDNGPENTGREDRKEMGSGYGGYYSVGSTGELRGRKRSLYEGGVRLPFIVRWPGRVPAGKVNKSAVLSAVDLLPTVCAAAGVRLPNGYAPDGENMLPVLLGDEKQRTTPLFWDWRGKETPKDCWPRGAVRVGDWKLVTDNAGRRELYRSVDDWAEGRNIASQHPEIVAKLSAQLKAWQATLPEQPAADNISRVGRPKRPDRGKTKQRGDADKKESGAQAEDRLPAQDKRGRTALEPKSSTGLVPLNELTPNQTYKGYAGGLYGNGSNSPPKEHRAAAILAAKSIQPLNINGEPDPEGKIVLISNGASDAKPEFDTFLNLAQADHQVNPRLVLVNTAQGGQEAGGWADPARRIAKGKRDPWAVQASMLQRSSVAPLQVQVVWMKQSRRDPATLGEFPRHVHELQRNQAVIIRRLKQEFPNLKLVYLSSRTYAGYAVNTGNPEPQGYEWAWANQWLIRDQIAGEPSLNFDPRRGDVQAPVLLWGPYLWTDGVKGRKSDDVVCVAADLRYDGMHPSEKGCRKVAEQLMQFLKAEPTAKSWFLAVDPNNQP